jgi:hypothetical protein
MRTTSSTGRTKILPSPIFPDFAVLDDHLDFDLGKEIHQVLGTLVKLGVAPLTTESFHLHRGQTVNSHVAERFLHVVELERLDDGFDLFHRHSGQFSDRCIPQTAPPASEVSRLHGDRKPAPPEGSVDQAQPVILEAIQRELAGELVTSLTHLLATLWIRQKLRHLCPELPEIRADRLASLGQQLSHPSATGTDDRGFAKHCLVGVPAPTLVERGHGYRQGACFEQKLVVAEGQVLHIKTSRLINRRAGSNEVNVETSQAAVSLVDALSGTTSA